ncbi:hypothetical protein [Lysobacter xanthus]
MDRIRSRFTAVALLSFATSLALAAPVVPKGKASPALIVQGGLAPSPGCGGDAVAIGPKQDDPAPRPPTNSAATAGKKGYDHYNAQRDAATGVASGKAAVAIGPKQDDPAPPPPATLAGCTPTGH